MRKYLLLIAVLVLGAVSIVDTQSGGWRIRVGSEERFVGTAAAPNRTGVTTLGTSARRWSTVFTQALDMTGALSSTGTVTCTKSGIGVTSTDCFVATNDTAAAVGAQQWSPRLRLRGRGWETTGGTSQPLDFWQEVQPAQSTNVNGSLVWSVSKNGAAAVEMFRLTNNQVGNIFVTFPSAGIFSWLSRSTLSAPADGELNLQNNGGTANGGMRRSYIVEANTGAKSPSALENNEFYTNTGDADGSTITLLNDPTVGSTIHVAVTAAQTITIAASAGETFNFGATTCGTSLTSNIVGSTATFVAATGGSGAIWVTTGAMGTWICTP